LSAKTKTIDLFVFRTRSAPREEKALAAYLAASSETWVGSAFTPEGSLYWCVMSLLLRSAGRWEREDGVRHLRRLLVIAHARSQEKGNAQQVKTTRLTDATPLDYTVYKPYLLFYGLVDGLYKYCFKVKYC
jgi:E3 ubiquitin-protein ligase UBR4